MAGKLQTAVKRTWNASARSWASTLKFRALGLWVDFLPVKATSRQGGVGGVDEAETEAPMPDAVCPADIMDLSSGVRGKERISSRRLRRAFNLCLSLLPPEWLDVARLTVALLSASGICLFFGFVDVACIFAHGFPFIRFEVRANSECCLCCLTLDE